MQDEERGERQTNDIILESQSTTVSSLPTPKVGDEWKVYFSVRPTNAPILHMR